MPGGSLPLYLVTKCCVATRYFARMTCRPECREIRGYAQWKGWVAGTGTLA